MDLPYSGLFLSVLILLMATCGTLPAETEIKCKSLQYAEFGEIGTLQCIFGYYRAVTWYTALNDDAILAYTGLETVGWGYASGEFDIALDGSLIINNVTEEHETSYTVEAIGDTVDSFETYTVFLKIIAHPVPGYLMVDGCNNDQYCVLDVLHDGNLTCTVSGIRPEVKLEWRAYHDGSLISFKQQQLKVHERGETYDVILTSNFLIPPNSGNRFTVECRVAGPNALLFAMSTKLDLLLQEAFPTNEPINLTNRRFGLLWILVVIIPILLFVMALLFVRYKGTWCETGVQKYEIQT